MGSEATAQMPKRVLAHVRDGMTLGLGSGATSAAFVQALGALVKAKEYKIQAVPSSLQVQILAERAGLSVVHPSSRISLYVDSCDQMDHSFRMIKGGGGALLKEKILMSSAESSIIMLEEGKLVRRLSLPVPVEVTPFAKNLVESKVSSMGGEPALRILTKGYPYITENGNLILDASFGQIADPPTLEVSLKSIPGVVEVGLFNIRPSLVYLARGAAGIEELIPRSKRLYLRR